MEYTEALMRELENLVVFEKANNLTEVGKKRIAALRECRSNFRRLHLPDGDCCSDKDLVEIGNFLLYLLSKKRKKRTLKVDRDKVTHADLENWKELRKRDSE